jgi:hypothetical protein
VQNREDM